MSAGVVEPLKELDNELIAGHIGHRPIDLVSTVNRSAKAKESAAAVSEPGPPRARENATVDDSLKSTENTAFFVDTAGDESISLRHTGPVPIPIPRSPASNSSDSSSGGDEVVFKGRNRQNQQKPHPYVVDKMTIQVQAVERTMQRISLESAAKPSPRRKSSPLIPAWQLRGHNDDDDLVADYIANMDDSKDDEEDAQDSQTRFQSFSGAWDLGGADGDFALAEESRSDVSRADADDHGEDDDVEDNAEEHAFATDTRANEIDDEALARLLARQEDLGIDEDELIITSAEITRYNNRFVATSNSRMADRQNHGAHTPWLPGKQGVRSKIPNASAVADAFDEMDLMDWVQHNPQRRPKSKRGQPTFDLSDSELEAHLQATFKKDRLRKKERKLEREELRTAGLLGKHGNPDDLRVKYPTGVTIDQIKEEIRTFLLGDDET